MTMIKPDRITRMHMCPYCKVRAEICQYDGDECIEHHCTLCDACWIQFEDGERISLETGTEQAEYYGD